MPILLGVICGFLHAIRVESSSCDRDDLPCKPNIFMAFYIAGPNIFTLLTQLIWKKMYGFIKINIPKYKYWLHINHTVSTFK